MGTSNTQSESLCQPSVGNSLHSINTVLLQAVNAAVITSANITFVFMLKLFSVRFILIVVPIPIVLISVSVLVVWSRFVETSQTILSYHVLEIDHRSTFCNWLFC